MSLLGRIAQEGMRRVASNPKFQALMERTDQVSGVRPAADRVAEGELTDDDASAELRAALPADDEIVREAVRNCLNGRTDYLRDRAYRLLVAAATNTPVRPIDPVVAELFERERAVGRLPLRDAFRRLAEIEPGLLELEQTVKAAGDWNAIRAAMDNGQPKLVGHGARSSDPLLKSDLVASLVGQYLQASVDSRERDMSAPFFGNRRFWAHTGGLFDRDRPRAAN